MVGIGLAGLGVAGSVWDLDDKIVERFPKLNPYFEYVEHAFIALLLLCSIGLFLYLLFTVRYVITALKNREWRLWSPRFQNFKMAELRADDLPEVMRLYGEITNGDTSLDVARGIYGRCRTGWRKAIDTRTSRLVAYFIVLPLTKKGQDALEQREFGFDAKECVDFFRTKHGRCSAYIGMVGAIESDKDAQMFIYNRLIAFINERNYTKLYARAGTERGLKLLRGKGFKPIFVEDKPELNVYFSKPLG